MAVWRVQHPGGGVERVEAPDEQTAVDFVNSKLKAAKGPEPGTRTGQFIDALKKVPGVGAVVGAVEDFSKPTPTDAADYERELVKRRAANTQRRSMAEGDIPGTNLRLPGAGSLNALTSSTVQPVMDEVGGLLAGVGNAAVNVGRRALNRPEVSSRAIYLANRDAENEYAAQQRGEHPIASGAGAISGALLAAPETGGAAVAARVAPRVLGQGAPGATQRLLSVAGNLPRVAATGAAYGGGMGLLEGDTAEERIANAKRGAAGGALLGPLIHVGAPALAKGAGVVGDLAGVIGEKTGIGPALADVGGKLADVFDPGRAMLPLTQGRLPPPREPFFGPGADAPSKATLAAIGMAQKKGMTPAALRARGEELKGLDPLTGEVIGGEGVGNLKAVMRRSGTSKDDVKQKLFERQRAQGGGVTSDFEDMLGVDPGAAAGDLDAMTEALRKQGGEEIEASTQGEHGLTNPQIEFMLNTPTGRRLRAEMESLFKDEGDQAMGLSMGRVEVPDPKAGASQFAAPTPGRELLTEQSAAPDLGPAPQVDVPRGPGKEPTRGPSALQYLRSLGHGIELSSKGEARAAGLKLGARRGGSDAQDMAQALHDAGYVGYPPDEKALWKILEDDAAGRRKLYAQEGDPEAVRRFRARQAAEEQNRAAVNEHSIKQLDAEDEFRQRQSADVQQEADWQRHMDEVGPDPDDWRSLAQGTETPEGGGTGANAPIYEPAYQEAYTPEALNRVRQYAREGVKYDFAGRPEPGSQNVAQHRWAQRFTDLLAGDEAGAGAAVPGLRGGLSKYHAGKAPQNIFDKAKGKLLTASTREWGQIYAAAKRAPGGLQAMKAAVANDVMEAAINGRVGDKRFLTDAVRGKMKLLFAGDEERPADFLARLQERAKLEGSRRELVGGSDTAGNLAAMENVEGMNAGFVERMANKLRSGNWKGAIGDALGSGVGGLLAEARTAGSSEAFRNELGHLLALSPSQFADVMERFPELDTSARKAVQAVLKGLMGGAVAGQGVANSAASEKEPA